MWKPIKAYALLWNGEKQKGFIKIVISEDTEYKVKVSSVAELDAIANIFRFERSVNYNVETGSFASGWVSLRDEDEIIS